MRQYASDSRKLSTAFFIMGVVLVVSIVFTYLVGRRATDLAEEVNSHREMIDHLGSLAATLIDAETGQRGYLLTGDKSYLQPYDAAVQRLPAEIRETLQMADQFPALRPQLKEIVDLIPQKLDELAQSIEIFRNDGDLAANAYIASHLGRKIMDQIRIDIRISMDAQEAELTSLLVEARDASYQHSMVMGSVALIDLGFLLWMFRRIRAEMRRRAAISTELADQREFLDVTLSCIGDGVLIADTSARILFINAVAQNLTGWTAAQAMGKPCADVFNIISESTRQRVESPVDKVLETGLLVGLANHTLLLRRDGTEIPIDDSGAPIRDQRGNVRGVVLVFRDFSEHRNTEAEIRRLNSQLQRRIAEWETAFNLAPAGLVVADNPQSTIVRRNPAMIKILRSADPRFEDPSFPSSFFRVQTRPIPMNKLPLHIAAAEGITINDVELDLIFETGRIVTLFGGAAPLLDEHGNPRGAIGAFQDITQIKKIENDLRNANLAKDQFLATLSHELRTPLTPVLGMLSAWESNPEIPEALRPDMQMLRRNIELEARLIDDLLDITRIARGRMVLTPELADAHALIRAITNMHTSEALAKRLDLQLRLDAPRHIVMADPARLQQVFWNVLKNATKFTPESGTVSITTANDSAGQLVIAVTDSGIGMDDKTLQTVFHPFEPRSIDTVRKFGGLGLGLSIAKTLIEAQGGTINASSDGPGLGSTFIVTIPVVAATAEANVSARPVPVNATPADARRLHILLVEDHADSARVLSRLLRSLGHQVSVAASVTDAIAHVGAVPLDLLLSDIGLPDGTGIDLIRHVRAAGKSFPAIAITGFGMDDDIQKCRDAGFNAHLTKPVNFQKLELLIQQYASA